jgi:hypothetical protein
MKVLLESRYNVLVEWENGEITSEPLNIFGKDDPVTCAVYACEHGLFEEEGWKRFKGIVKCGKKMLRMVNQSHIKATRNAPRYKFGYHIPCNYDEPMQFDLKNAIPSGIWATRTLHHLRQDTRRSVPILSMTASMTADTRHGWLPMVTSWIFL